MRSTTYVCIVALASWPAAVLAHPATAGLVADLQSGSPSVRAHTATALGRIGDPSAVPALIKALKDPDRAVRREAAKALGFMKDNRAVPGLMEALSDRDVNVRTYAVYALAEIDDAKAADALLQALRDSEWCVRDQAAWALRALGDARVAGSLAALLKDEGVDASQVIWILKGLGPDVAVKHLAGLLGDANAEVRLRAVRALGEIGGKEVVEPLVAALKDGSAPVRAEAVALLLKARDKRALEPLKQLAGREKDLALRQAAEEAVRQLSRHEYLAAHWSFDDKDTRIARDASGRGIEGTIIGCTPVKGKLGHALMFGPDSYIELGKPPNLSVGGKPFTVAAWVKSGAPNGVVVARGGAFCGFSLYIKDGVPRFGIHRIQDGPAHIAAGKEKVVGDWVHLAGVVRERRIELYVNGKLAATEKTPGYLPGNPGQGMQIGFDDGNSPAEITDAFEGVIDEVKAFDAALSEEEIAEQFHAGQEK